LAGPQNPKVRLAKRLPVTVLLDKLDGLCRRNDLDLDQLAQYRGLRALEAELLCGDWAEQEAVVDRRPTAHGDRPTEQASRQPAGLVCRMATIELDLPPVAEAVPRARHRFQALLAAVGVPEDVSDAAVLVVSELVTNGVVHSGGDIVLRAFIGSDEMHIEVVTDDGPADRPTDPGSDTDAGRGLNIVEAFTTGLTIDRAEPGRRRVTCQVPLAV
jgi:anti-sigma regulatory factor (Ser/Thr protein kinase)